MLRIAWRRIIIVAVLFFALPAAAYHSADTTEDWKIDLSELLRVIQFFNSDGFGCGTDTEDGYAPESDEHSCAPHDSDYGDQDWSINLSELLRIIQFFNSAGYGENPETEDGYEPIGGSGNEGEGDGLVAVPNLIGRTLAEVESLLTDAGLTLGEGLLEYSNIFPLDTIFEQSPLPETEIGAGSEVVVTISLGPIVQGEGEGEGFAEGEVPAPEIQHVIFVLFDAMGAGHMGTYGYDRDTTPFLDQLAAEGVVFEEAIATSSYTRESVASMFTGMYPSHQPYGLGWCGSPDNTTPTLAEVFQSNGYTTAFFSATPMLTFPQFQRGWDVSMGLTGFSDSGGGTQLHNWMVSHYLSNRNNKTFTYLHYLDPHAGFMPPDEHYLKFADSIEPNPWFMFQVRAQLNELIADGFGPGDPRFEDFLVRYDAEISWVDEQFQTLYNTLSFLNLLNNTLIVFTSDHGEEFLEHGYVEHAWKLYYETQHIPMIFWAPGNLTPARVPGMVSATDFRPTLLRLAGLDDPAGDLDGRPLFRRTHNAWEPNVIERPIFAELSVQMRTMSRTVFFDDWQYIQAQKWLTAEECAPVAAMLPEIRAEFEQGLRPLLDPWGPVVHEELYDRATDPGTQTDLVLTDPLQLHQGRALMDFFHAASPEQVSDAEKCGWTTLRRSQAAMDALAALGYID